MEHWWDRGIVEAGKLPLLVALLAFVLTFVVTRGITRSIRAGRGPFRDVSSGGVHIHHAVPGLVLMVAGGFGAVATGRSGWAAGMAALVFGVGAGLVLDEFALILYLSDVYWSDQGRRSVELVVLTAALVGMVLAGFTPLGVDTLSEEERQNRALLSATVASHFLFAIVALAKDKPRMAVFGALMPFVALTAALRLARPGSWWDRRFYHRRPRARARAEKRARRHDIRWGPWQRRVEDALGGIKGP
ncbi:hypothetical protein PJ985_20525 [Streptomyces sp. ACA25]|uniref:hypothetical protein n=1 Tax=Streptomyces sp. ACA25 TaxID=3022596 RepID=UPI0023076E95|nr:hypothetical protein [Streptomyces sp. ACA25]MDB1089947.1 hypothetical protein [Streptomyces sp. ACA25]